MSPEILNSPTARRIGHPLLLLAVTLAAYYPAINAGTVWDDDAVFANEWVASPTGIFDIWFHPSRNIQEEHYWPVPYTFFWAMRRAFSASLPAHHLAGILLHTANAILLFALLRRFRPRLAAPASLLFAIHPLCVESVAWIIEIKNTLNLLFLLAALNVAVWLPRRTYAEAMVCGLFAFSLLSKSTTSVIPPLAMLGMALNGSFRRNFLESGYGRILFVASVLTLIFAGLELSNVLRVRALAPDLSHELPLLDRLQLGSRALSFYLGKILWPSVLYPLYPKWSTGTGFSMLLSLFAGGSLIALLYQRGMTSALIICYAALVAPASGIVNFSYMRLSHASDRFAYAPLLPILVILASEWRAMAQPVALRFLSRLFAGLLLLALFLITSPYARAYRGNQTLFSRTLGFNPSAWAAHYNLANELSDANRLEEALLHFETAARLNARDASVQHNLANTLARLGRFSEALPHYDLAVKLRPGDERILHNARACAVSSGNSMKQSEYELLIENSARKTSP